MEGELPFKWNLQLLQGNSNNIVIDNSIDSFFRQKEDRE